MLRAIQLGSCAAFCAFAISFGVGLPSALGVDDKPAQPDKAAKADDKPADEKPVVDRYALPEGDVAALVKFVDELKAFRPSTREEFLAHRQKGSAAIKKAAEKILSLEKDKTSAAYKKANGILFEERVKGIGAAAPDEQKKIVEELKTYLRDKELVASDYGLAMQVAPALEYGGKPELAMELYAAYGEGFKKSKDPQLASVGEMMGGAARRLGALGKPLEIKGTKMDGSEFDIASLKGKVVLVDFWATWCGPCIAEIPNVKKNYDLYHEKGFEVVGISLDQDRSKLEQFLEKEKTPWITLHENNGTGRNALATHYGIMGIPTVMLVDQEGNAVSLNARGPELGKQLEKLLGKAEEKPAAESKPAAEGDAKTDA